MVYDGCKFSNPYLGKDNRLRIYINCPDEQKKVISYPKFLMERYLDRYLADNETIDHIDCNPLNNDIKNLRILNRSDHAKLDVKRVKSQSFICPVCQKEFTLSGKKLHNCIQNRKKGKQGPFCSKSCAGKYGTNIQHKKFKKLPVLKCVPEYTTNKQLGASSMETSRMNGANSGKPSVNGDGNPELDK